VRLFATGATAIFAANDLLVLGALRAAREAAYEYQATSPWSA